jgi:hypothetical protein
MPRYLVRCVPCASGPGEAWRDFRGISGSLTVEADDRPSAYAWLYKRFKRPGQEVKVTPRYGPSGQKSREGQLLGFSEEELKAVRELGVPIEAGYPKDGVQIEDIISLE